MNDRNSLTIAVAAIAVVAALAVAGFLLLGDDDDDGGDSGEIAAGGGPVLIESGDLDEVADEAGHPVYWVGERDGTKLEATVTDDGRAYIRYLDEDAEVGDEAPEFLTIGTYPYDDAVKVLTELSQREGSEVTATDSGGIAVNTAEAPESVYLASPDETLEIEVYDPDPDEAKELATSGEVVAVD